MEIVVELAALREIERARGRTSGVPEERIVLTTPREILSARAIWRMPSPRLLSVKTADRVA
jgi:hypothetical protein